MDSIYHEKQSPAKEQQKQQEQVKKKKAERAEKKNKFKKAAEAAQAMIQAATSGADLAVSGESLRMLAECMGNQSMVRALAGIAGGGNGNLRLSATEFLPSGSDEGLPENQITISWPALRHVVRLNRTGQLPKGLFPISALKEEILHR